MYVKFTTNIKTIDWKHVSPYTGFHFGSFIARANKNVFLKIFSPILLKTCYVQFLKIFSVFIGENKEQHFILFFVFFLYFFY